MSLELGFSVVAVLILLYVGYYRGGNLTAESLLLHSRDSIYGTLVPLFGTMFGFIIATTALCLNLTDRERFSPLRRTKAYRKLWNYFLWAIVVLGGGAIVTLSALVVDRNFAPILPLAYLVIFFLLISTFFVANCVYALKLIIDVATQEYVGRPGGRENTSPNLVETADADR
jgi:fatty acid desaturase